MAGSYRTSRPSRGSTTVENPANKRHRLRNSLIIGAIVAIVSWIIAGPFLFRNWHTPIVHKPSDFGIAFEAVSFNPPDQPITIRAWWMPAHEAKAAIIMLHGGANNKSQPFIEWLPLAHELIKHGYSVLDPDLRNHGQSDNSAEGVTGGMLEANDVIGAINYLRAREPALRFGAIGYSMGGQTALFAAAKDRRIEAVVSEATWASDLRSTVFPNFAAASSGLPTFLFEGPFMWSMEQLHGWIIPEAGADTVVGSIAPSRVLLIHDSADPIVPVDDCRLLSKADPSAQVWIISARADSSAAKSAFGTHALGYQLHRQEYLDHVIPCFDESFAASKS